MQIKKKLTSRQVEILSSLHFPEGAQTIVLKIEAETLSFQEIERVCGVINAEFTLKGLLPDFEPNKYGLELEDLLDVVNRPRITSTK